MSSKKHLSKIELKKIIEAKLSNLKSLGVHGTAIKKYRERYYSSVSGKQFGKLTSLMNELNVINKNVNKKPDIEKAYDEWKVSQYITVIEKQPKENEFSVEDVINTPQMVLHTVQGNTITQSFQSFSRDIFNIKNLLRKYKGKNILVKYGDYTFEYDVPAEHFTYWFNNNSVYWDWRYSSSTSLFYVNQYQGNINISFFVEISKKVEPQFYLDGINHCVFHPIKLWAQSKMHNVVEKSTKQKYQYKINYINEFIEEYKYGVPDNEKVISEICNKLQININIETPFQDKIFDCKSTIKGGKNFKFINTRLNHIDCTNIKEEIDFNEVINIENISTITMSELKEIKEELDLNKTFYTFGRNNKIITSINTLYKSYKVYSEFNDLKNEFLVSSGLINCKVDDIDDHELSKFIRCGTHYNVTKDIRQTDKKIIPNDMTKAYANYKQCYMYEGFLGKITDFRKCDKIMGIGLYCIDNLDFSKCNEKFKYYEHNLNMYNNKCVYTSTELKLLSSYGVIYDILYGCWGVNPIDFTLDDEMINGYDIVYNSKGEEIKIRHYAKLFGSLDSHGLTEKIWLNGSKEYFENMAYHSNLKCNYNESGEGYFIKNKTHNYHLGHITAFITAYQRISVMEQLMAMDHTKIIKVVTDCIFCEDHEYKMCNVFVKKYSEKSYNQKEASGYLSGLVQYTITDLSENRDNHEISLYKGVGGSGKTHININDSGLIKKSYFVTSWKLANEKRKEFSDVYCDVMANLLSTDPEKINSIKKYNNVLIVDECSMISNENKNYIIDTYKGCKIIFCGDIGYQLDGVDTLTEKGGIYTKFNEERINFIQNFTYSRRCKCEVLRKLSNRLREFIEMNSELQSVRAYIIGVFKQAQQTITKGRFKDKYKSNDSILCWRKEVSKKYTEQFTGKYKLEKYMVIDNKVSGKNRGDIIMSKDELINGKINGFNVEIKHAFTVHSVQGITVKDYLYIDINDMKDVKMIYTAVSRSEYFDKIKLIV